MAGDVAWPARRGSAAPSGSTVAGLLVPQIERLAGAVGHRVVRPRGELVLAAVSRPGVAAALGRDLKAEAGIGDDVDPWRRRRLARRAARHIFAAVRRRSRRDPLKNSSAGSAPRLAARGRRRDAAARRRVRPCGLRRRSSCSASVPRRPTQHDAGDARQQRTRLAAASDRRAARRCALRAPPSPRGRDWLVRTAASRASEDPAHRTAAAR